MPVPNFEPLGSEAGGHRIASVLANKSDDERARPLLSVEKPGVGRVSTERSG
jgi:hypothetical protein